LTWRRATKATAPLRFLLFLVVWCRPCRRYRLF